MQTKGETSSFSHAMKSNEAVPTYLPLPNLPFPTASIPQRPPSNLYDSVLLPGNSGQSSNTVSNHKIAQSLPAWVVPAPAFQKKRYIVESLSSAKANITEHTLKKNVENFILDLRKRILYAAGPRKAYGKEAGYVYAIENEEGNCKFIAVGDNMSMCEEYCTWLKKKLRHRLEPQTAVKVLNIVARSVLPHDTLEISLFDFYYFIKTAFPQWHIVYDPELSSTVVVCRVRCVEESKDGTKGRACETNKRTCEDRSTEETVSASTSPKVSKEYLTENKEECVPASDNVSSYEDDYKELPKKSQMEIIAQWMLDQEIQAYTEALKLCRFSQTVEFPMKLSKSSELYRNLPKWIKCVFVIHSKSVIIHRASKDEDIEYAWQYMFPLLRRFIAFSSFKSYFSMQQPAHHHPIPLIFPHGVSSAAGLLQSPQSFLWS